MVIEILFTILFILISILVLLWFKSYRAPQLFGKVISRVKTDKKVVALTYDDGPNPPYTNELVKLFHAYGAKATFFVVGQEAEKHPEVIKLLYQNGHELGNHSWSHKQLIFKSMEYIIQEIEKTDKLLRDLGYQGVIQFRAPYGRKLVALPRILADQNRAHILFDVVPDDWEKLGTEVIVNKVLSQIKPGSIILMHDGTGDTSQTVRATEKIIQKLKGDGYQFVTISELMRSADK
jgi:peptidoglycan/xylan/chitin deacetylase (PgdA/CDA1 family)